MIDLSNISLPELEAMVAAERERRKAAAVAQLEEIAASYGFTLAKIFGATHKAYQRTARNKPASRESRRVHGVRSAQIEAALRAGDGAEAIAKRLGWRNSGAVYLYAKRLGIPMANGRAVLS